MECKKAEPRDTKLDVSCSQTMSGSMASLLAASHIALPSAALIAHTQGSAAAGAVSAYPAWSPPTQGKHLTTGSPQATTKLYMSVRQLWINIVEYITVT